MVRPGPYRGVTSSAQAMERAFDSGNEVVWLATAWVPRSLCTPTKRHFVSHDPATGATSNSDCLGRKATKC